ncbi:hypothetical protein Tco_0464201 [Tanacetum coccineum]
MLSPTTFRPFRQRHVAGEIYPQRNVAGERLMGVKQRGQPWSTAINGGQTSRKLSNLAGKIFESVQKFSHSYTKFRTIFTEKFNVQRLYVCTYLMHYYNNFIVMDDRLDSSGETKRKFESAYSGGTLNTPDSGKVFQYWHCCASEDPFDLGCTASPHCSYDD